MNFIETTHLQDILESSEKRPVIIFKYSNSCQSSTDLRNDIEAAFRKNKLKDQVFLVTVQVHRNLSRKIEEYFHIKHESPQVIVVKDKKVLLCLNHNFINMSDLLVFSL